MNHRPPNPGAGRAGVALALLLGMLGWALACGPPGPPTRSLRILTYNTAFVSITVDVPPPVPDVTIRPNEYHFANTTVDERAAEIAQGILRSDQDVVVLNEVFSDEARATLVFMLQGAYPNHVSKLAGVPPVPFPTIGSLIENQTGIELPDIPGFGDYAVYPGDSGLMVFSRYPFLSLGPGVANEAVCGDQACVLEGRNTANPNGLLASNDVAFKVFKACSDFDCFASKGLAMVKLDTANTPTYVAFTHLQADYPPNDFFVPARLAQYAEMKSYLESFVPQNDLDGGAPIYLTGDLNTPGGNKQNSSSSEWFDLYHPSTAGGRFWACGGLSACTPSSNERLTVDVWGFETSPLDLGITNEKDGERLDYILRSHPGDVACMQHVKIPWEIAKNGSAWYSDHLPVLADLNGRGQRCTPNRDRPPPFPPLPVTFPDMACDSDPATPPPPCDQDFGVGPGQGATLVQPGSFQWYVIDEPGSYSIKLDPAAAGENVAYDVYQGEDLSRPLAPFEPESHPDWGEPWDMLNPPYYVRVYAVDNTPQRKPDRTAANRAYFINFHQHLCRDAEDACFLPAGEPETYEHPFKWPQQTVLTDVTEAYFRFKTSGVKGGRLDPAPDVYPSVKVRNEVGSSWNLDCFRLRFEEHTPTFPPVFVRLIDPVGAERNQHPNFPDDWDFDGLADERWIAPDLDGDVVGELKRYYAVVERGDDLACELPIGANVHYETTMGYFVPGKVNCYAQYDDSGIGEDDHIRFKAFFDPIGNYPWWNYCDSNPCHQQAYDEPGGHSYLDAVSSLRGWFVDDVHLYMYEDENGTDFHLGVWNGDIQPVSPYDDQVAKHQLIYADGNNSDDADYYYLVRYRICREERHCL